MSYKSTKILFLALGVAALSSCSSAYRMGQTPDDVYYSPGKVQAQAQGNDDSYVAGNNNSQRYMGAQAQQGNAYNSNDDYDAYRNDRFLRMSIGSSYRMGAYNDFGMYNGYYNSIGYNSYNDIYSPWNNFYTWNSYYNPYNTFSSYNPYYGGGYYGGGYYGGGYGGGIVVINKGSGGSTATPVSRPRAFNADAYLYRNQTQSAGANTTSRPNGVYLGGRYNNSNSASGSNNNNMRRMPGSGNTYYNTTNTNNGRSMNTNNSSNNNSYSAPRTYEAPTRSYTPSSAPASSGSSSSGGGSAPVSRPSRGN